MAVAAFTVAQSPSHRFGAIAEPLNAMACAALGRGVAPDEWVVRAVGMLECIEVETRSLVTVIASALWFGEPELSGVHILMAARALAWESAIARATPCFAVFFAGRVASVASRLRMRSRQRP